MAEAHSTTRTRKRSHGGPHFWIALLLALCAATASWIVFTRDVGWPERNRAARALGLAAEEAGDSASARARYEAALAANPYDWNTRLRLADLLNHRLAARGDALRHYLLALAHSPDPAVVPGTEEEIRILRLLRSGELEDPADAVADMFAAAGSGAKGLFLTRLDAGLRRGGDSYWAAWRARGRGEILGARVENGRNGLYDAVVELGFPDGVTMSLHLRCPLRNIWRLSLAFP